MALFHTILHPTDFDEPSKEAFRVARALAPLLGAKVVAFHIAPPPAVLKGDGQVILDPKNPTPTDFWADYRAAAADSPGLAVQYSVVIGQPGDAKKLLFALIGKEPTGTLIVMGTHGRTGLSRLIWGNRAEEVVREAPCPVLVVKETAS